MFQDYQRRHSGLDSHNGRLCIGLPDHSGHLAIRMRSNHATQHSFNARHLVKPFLPERG